MTKVVMCQLCELPADDGDCSSTSTGKGKDHVYVHDSCMINMLCSIGKNPEITERDWFSVGSLVKAKKLITEDHFPVTGNTHVHANTGDTGTVVHVCEGDPTVRFHKSGTASIVCKDSEIEPIR